MSDISFRDFLFSDILLHFNLQPFPNLSNNKTLPFKQLMLSSAKSQSNPQQISSMILFLLELVRYRWSFPFISQRIYIMNYIRSILRYISLASLPGRDFPLVPIGSTSLPIPPPTTPTGLPLPLPLKFLFPLITLSLH